MLCRLKSHSLRAGCRLAVDIIQVVRSGLALTASLPVRSVVFGIPSGWHAEASSRTFCHKMPALANICSRFRTGDDNQLRRGGSFRTDRRHASAARYVRRSAEELAIAIKAPGGRWHDNRLHQENSRQHHLAAQEGAGHCLRPGRRDPEQRAGILASGLDHRTRQPSAGYKGLRRDTDRSIGWQARSPVDQPND